MIQPVEPRVPDGEERIEEFEGLGGARLNEVTPGELPCRKVAGVELDELAHVERDALLGLSPAGDFAVSDGVRALVFSYYVVPYVEYQRSLWRAFEVAQGRFDIDEAEHLVRIDAGLYVRAPEIGVERLSARRREFYPVNVDQGIETRQEREECLTRPWCGGDELVHREGTPRILFLPAGDPVDDVALHLAAPLVDGNVPIPP